MMAEKIGVLARIGLALAALMTASGAGMADTVMLEITSASASFDEASARPTLNIRLAPAGRKAFTDFTVRFEGSAIDILVDDAVLSSPVIQSPIYSDALTISGDFTVEEAQDLAARLGSGEKRITVRMQPM